MQGDPREETLSKLVAAFKEGRFKGREQEAIGTIKRLRDELQGNQMGGLEAAAREGGGSFLDTLGSLEQSGTRMGVMFADWITGKHSSPQEVAAIGQLSNPQWNAAQGLRDTAASITKDVSPEQKDAVLTGRLPRFAGGAAALGPLAAGGAPTLALSGAALSGGGAAESFQAENAKRIAEGLEPLPNTAGMASMAAHSFTGAGIGLIPGKPGAGLLRGAAKTGTIGGLSSLAGQAAGKITDPNAEISLGEAGKEGLAWTLGGAAIHAPEAMSTKPMGQQGAPSPLVQKVQAKMQEPARAYDAADHAAVEAHGFDAKPVNPSKPSDVFLQKLGEELGTRVVFVEQPAGTKAQGSYHDSGHVVIDINAPDVVKQQAVLVHETVAHGDQARVHDELMRADPEGMKRAAELRRRNSGTTDREETTGQYAEENATWLDLALHDPAKIEKIASAPTLMGKLADVVGNVTGLWDPTQVRRARAEGASQFETQDMPARIAGARVLVERMNQMSSRPVWDGEYTPKGNPEFVPPGRDPMKLDVPLDERIQQQRQDYANEYTPQGDRRFVPPGRDPMKLDVPLEERNAQAAELARQQELAYANEYTPKGTPRTGPPPKPMEPVTQVVDLPSGQTGVRGPDGIIRDIETPPAARYSIRNTIPDDTRRVGLAAPSGNFSAPNPESFLDWLRVGVEDQLRRPRVVQRGAKNIDDASNVDQATDLIAGRAAWRGENVDRSMHEVQTLIGRRGVDLDVAGDYVYARHAADRNRLMAQRGEKSSGMTDAEAADIIARVEASPNADAYKRVAEIHDKLTNDTLVSAVMAGDVTPEAAAQWRKDFGEHFASLITVDPEGKAFIQGGKSFQTKGPFSKRAEGRASRADNPLVTTFSKAYSQINRNERLRIGQTLAEQVRKNPDPEFWYVAEPGKPISKADEPYTFTTKENGKEVKIVVRDQAFVEAMKGLDPLVAGHFMHAVKSVLQFVKNVRTTYSTSFLGSNTQRDIGQAVTKSLLEQDIKVKDFKDALPGAAKALIQIARNPNAKGPVHDMIREAGEHGAFIGWMQRHDWAGVENRLRAGGFVEGNAVLRTAKQAKEFAHDVGQVGERLSRAAAYIAARKAGKTPDQAAKVAVHITTPFNRRGKAATIIDALKVFTPAATQGAISDVRALKRAGVKRSAQVLGTMMAIGFFESAWNRQQAGDDWIENTDDVTKQSKFRLFLGGDQPVGFHLPRGFSAVTYTGVMLEHLMHGDIKPGQASTKIALAYLNSLSPVSGTDPAEALTPTLAEVPTHVWRNQNAFGTPLRPETYDHTTPDSELAFSSTPKPYVDTARKLNELAGGNSARPGTIMGQDASISPSTLQESVNFLFGGVGQTINRATRVMENIINGREVPVTDIEVLREFVGGKNEKAAVSKRYYEMRNEAHIQANELEDRISVGPLSGKSVQDRVKEAEKQIKQLRKSRTPKNSDQIDAQIMSVQKQLLNSLK